MTKLKNKLPLNQTNTGPNTETRTKLVTKYPEGRSRVISDIGVVRHLLASMLSLGCCRLVRPYRANCPGVTHRSQFPSRTPPGCQPS